MDPCLTFATGQRCSEIVGCPKSILWRVWVERKGRGPCPGPALYGRLALLSVVRAMTAGGCVSFSLIHLAVAIP
mgnify:CR=1 FL=1